MSWGESRQGGREKERGGGIEGKGGVLRDGRGCVLVGMSEFIVGNGVVRVLRGGREVGKDRMGDRSRLRLRLEKGGVCGRVKK